MTDDVLRREFYRNIFCLLGLTFDVLGLDEAISEVREAPISGRRLVVSTPNLNFVITAMRDLPFRQTVHESDLCLLDGMPLLWVSRLLGAVSIQKASGSDLFQELWLHPDSEAKPLSVFFFGGMKGVAERACRNIAKQSGGLQCSGYLDPGIGSVEALSKNGLIDSINRSRSDFLVVALGARKGQLWIDKNRERLNSPVISHLGAVVNFVAGNIRRAPVWMQRSGFEWLWRIYQEPALWRRYFTDGIRFGPLMVNRVLPYAWWRRRHADLLKAGRSVSVRSDEDSDSVRIAFSGACVATTIAPLRDAFTEAAESGKHVILDLSAVPAIDGAFLGLCLLLRKHLNHAGLDLSFTGMNDDIRRIFHWNCVEYLL